MSDRPTSPLFRWARTSTIIKEPTPAKKDQGWKIGDKEPAQWINWLLQYMTDWINYAIGRTDYYDEFLVPHPTDINAHSNATSTQRGFMSASDKAKLDDLHNYVPPEYYTVDQIQDLGTILVNKASIDGDPLVNFSAKDGISNKEVVNISQFSSIIAQTGETYLPNGLILKWGKISDVSLNSSEQIIIFQNIFPNQCFLVDFTISKNNPTITSAAVLKQGTLTTSGCTAFIYNNGVAETGDLYYKAIGY